jgi:hypothetical protein
MSQGKIAISGPSSQATSTTTFHTGALFLADGGITAAFR